MHPPNGHLSQWILNQFPPGYLGHAVDVGASDGVSINTTFALERAHRWTVLSVEANPEFLPTLKKIRARVEGVACDERPGEAIFHVNTGNPEAYSGLTVTDRTDLVDRNGAKFKRITVPVETVDRLLDKWEFPKLDALCVDVEGTELAVLKGANLQKWRPLVVIFESWDEQSPKTEQYLGFWGYEKRGRNVHNTLMVRRNG